MRSSTSPCTSKFQSGFLRSQKRWSATLLERSHIQSRERKNQRELWHQKAESEPITGESTDHTGNDESVKQHDPIINHYVTKLTELYQSEFSQFCSTQLSVNKFWQSYYGVINLTNYELNNLEIQILGKGLKFCPTPPMFDHGPLKESIDKFFRSALLKLFFSGHESDDNAIAASSKGFDHPDLRLPSQFKPNMPSNLEHIYCLIMEELLGINPTHGKRNLTNAEFTTLNRLKDNNEIIIKKADKGSNFVLMTHEHYLNEGQRQLNNKQFYRKLTENPTKKHKKLIDCLVDDIYNDRELSDKCYKYLKSGGNRTPVLYMVPKIHKNLHNPPGRPIVSGVDSPTEKISHLLDILLQPYVQETSSYI